MKKIGLVFLTLVMALGSLGAAYAMWSDKVFVNTNISTGNVSIAVNSASILDSDAPNGVYYPTNTPDYTCNPGFVFNQAKNAYFWKLDKNVAWGTVQQAGEDVEISLYNTYPCNFNEAAVYISNNGTIPVKIWKTEVWIGDNKIGEFDHTGQYWAFDINGDQANDIEVSYGDNFGGQLEPGGGPAEISYWIHTLQAAPQGENFTFTFKIVAVQYNEYAPLP